jgi:hypothetical protein
MLVQERLLGLAELGPVATEDHHGEDLIGIGLVEVEQRRLRPARREKCAEATVPQIVAVSPTCFADSSAV